MQTTRQSFLDCMDDDFNTAGALGHLFDLVRSINQARDAGVNAAELVAAQNLLRELTGVFGLELERPQPSGGDAAKFIDLLVEVRSELRNQKLWSASDLIRNRLAELGVILEDGKGNTTWRWEI
jgi:cysteinyl-tRNA synthetase